MQQHSTEVEPLGLLGIRVRRAGSDEWQDVTAELVGEGQRVVIPEESTMRAKCVSCGAVNAISANEGDEQAVGWGCGECKQMQVIVPSTLEQEATGPHLEALPGPPEDAPVVEVDA